MSILNLSFQANSITAGFRINVSAKKNRSAKQQNQSAKQKSFTTSTGRDRRRLEPLKKDAPPQQLLVSDAPELTTTNFRSNEQTALVSDAPELTTTKIRSNEQTVAVNGPDQKNPGALLVADRDSVLNACVRTSAGLSFAGVLLRQVSHWGAEGGWPVPDIATLMPFRTELWHVIPTVGVVVLVTSLRQLLQQVWPDFAQSSRVANNQVLRSLGTVDMLAVSCLSGVSEEWVFRGALLPLLGPDWRGVLGAGVFFGVLHVSGGRNASFAVWASAVGVAYGILGLYTCDLVAPMAAHSMANFLGGAIWKFSQNDGESKSL